MVKKIIIFSVILIGAFIAWRVYNPFKEPTFVAINAFAIEKMEGQVANVKATAVFNNPNDLDATLLNTELKVYSNGAFVGNISQTAITPIMAKCNFELPLYFKIDLLKLGYSQSIGGLLENALNKEKAFPVRFEGYCRIKTLGAVHKIPIEFADEIKFQ